MVIAALIAFTAHSVWEALITEKVLTPDTWPAVVSAEHIPLSQPPETTVNPAKKW